MKSAIKVFGLVFLVVGIGFTQSPETSNTSAAYVYVGTVSSGIYAYTAAANGILSPMAGSPFKQTSGLAIGSNGKYFITLGTTNLHAYVVEANGAIGKQESVVNTEDFDGSICGANGTDGAVLDHGGTIHVLQDSTVEAGSGYCAAYQSFNLSKTGGFTFEGTDIADGSLGDRLSFLYNLPTFTANDQFAYANFGEAIPADLDPYGSSVPSGFIRKGNGELQDLAFSTTFPPAGSIGDYYAFVPAAGTDNYLAMTIAQVQLPYGEDGPAQLASFTVDGKGNIKTTNTAENMPIPATVPEVMNMSPSGNLLAVGPGLQIFHFNGAKPITKYTGLLPTAPIQHIHWDNNNHVYALSSNNLYVYTVTPTSVVEAPGSPYTIPTANALNVMPR